MIASIRGKLLKAGPISAIIEVGGLGYFINLPVTTAEKLPLIGQEARLHTHTIYREDTQSLYGFASEEERDFFALLIDKVSGVGPKVGLSMMSKLPLDGLIDAISSENAALLAKVPGIGKKTAERVIIELKDKLAGYRGGAGISSPAIGQLASSSSTIGPSKTADAELALLSLGYRQPDAAKSIKKALESLGPQATTEELIRAAL